MGILATVNEPKIDYSLFIKKGSSCVLFSECQVHASHKRSLRHRVALIYLISLCQQVFASEPQAHDRREPVGGTDVQQTEVFFCFVVASRCV